MRLFLTTIALLALVGESVTVVAAEEFRIESKVYVGDTPEPVSSSLTLFRARTVYDFLAEPTQIAVFRKSFDGELGRIILLDPARKLRTELSTDQILGFTLELKHRNMDRQDPFLKFGSNPTFEKQFDQREGRMTLTSPAVSYRLLTIEAKSSEAMQQYREFSDWYVRLGAMLQPGISPFPRLAVNASLSEHQVIPREVHLTIPAFEPERKHEISMHSQHRVAWRLSHQDQEQIDQADKFLVEFELVDFNAFRDSQ